MSNLPSLTGFRRRDGTYPSPPLVVLLVRTIKDPKGPVVANVLVERREEYEVVYKSDEVTSASLVHSCERIVALGDEPDRLLTKFRATYDSRSNTVNLVGGGVFNDLAGLEGARISTYVLWSVVQWAKQWPSADVMTIELFKDDGRGDNKNRRNRLYEQFGIEFDYTSDEKTAGRSKPMKVADLLDVSPWEENITVEPLDQFHARLVYENRTLKMDLSFREEAVRDAWQEVRRRDRRPLRWAFGATLQNIVYSRWFAHGVLAGLAVFVLVWSLR